MNRIILTGAVFCFAISLAFAQQDTQNISIGTRISITSKTLGETRELYVYRPNNVNIRLPLFIVFDGESLFNSVVSAVQFMNYSQELPQIPEAMVVGIPNTDRNRDMPIPQLYEGKGEVNFSHFLSDELIPMLNSKYKLNGYIVLIGHSQGGLFASYLLTQSVGLFHSVIALDAPMDVDQKVAGIKEKIAQLISDPANKVAYASIEAVYGWGKGWDDTMAKTNGTLRTVYQGETHESMAHKGIYDGLKFIYKDFAPPKRDMSLIGLLHHYEGVSEKFGSDYIVPKSVLLASANRKIMDSRKDDALELVQFAEDNYGPSERINLLRTKASKLTKAPDPLVDFYLTHPKPSANEVKPYLGRWVGDLDVRQGQRIPIDMEIKIENGKGKMIEVLPWPPYNKQESEIFFISSKGELVFGRKNRGAGVVISTATINSHGALVGEEKLIGFVIPDDMPEEIKTNMKFVMENPNTFDLKKK